MKPNQSCLQANLMSISKEPIKINAYKTLGSSGSKDASLLSPKRAMARINDSHQRKVKSIYDR